MCNEMFAVRTSLRLFAFAIILGVLGCQDKRMQLAEVIDDGILVNPTMSTICSIDTCRLNPLVLKKYIIECFQGIGFGEMTGGVTCFLTLKCGEMSDYVKHRSYISGGRLKVIDLFHIQSIAVTKTNPVQLRTDEGYAFFVQGRNGKWRVFCVSPIQNGFSSVGVTGYGFSCLERCWMCGHMEGDVPLSPSMFMMCKDISEVFVVEMNSSNAALRYSSSAGIEALRTDSKVRILDLCWRTPNCMIFVPTVIQSKVKSGSFPPPVCDYWCPHAYCSAAMCVEWWLK